MKSLTAATAAAALPTLSPSTANASAGSTLLDMLVLPFSCIEMPSPDELEICIRMRNGIPRTGLKLEYYRPVAFIETVKGPFESIFFSLGNLSIASRTAKNPRGSAEQSFECRIWSLPDWIFVLNSVAAACFSCGFRDNPYSSLGDIKSSISDLGNVGACAVYGHLLGGSAGAMLAEAGNMYASMQAGMGFSSDQDSSYYPSLLYTTEIDLIHWRTGCRDLLESVEGTPGAMACGLEEAAETFTDAIDINIPNLTGGNCIGSWGSLYPRQNRSVGTSDIIGAGLTTYRALHLAKHDLGLLDFDVNTNGKLMPFYPDQGGCLKPGQNAIRTESAWKNSHDGNYGFIWWEKVTCCQSAAGALRTVGECYAMLFGE